MATPEQVISAASGFIGINGAQFWPLYNAAYGTAHPASTDWCAAFIRLCGQRAGISLELNASNPLYVPSVRDAYIFAGRYYMDAPRVGDLVFFDWSRPGKTAELNRGSHAGIITALDAGGLYAIEGNTEDACQVIRYSAFSASILGFGRPAYTGSGSGWIVTRDYLTQAQMENNASLVWGALSARGWSMAAVAGVLGNVEAESTINPGIIENRLPNPPASWAGVGYGLVQWTPGSKIWRDDPAAIDNGAEQCRRIHEEVYFGMHDQYYQTPSYPISGKAFIKLDDPALAASAFVHNYERPASYDHEPARRENAVRWYTYLSGHPLPPGPSPTPATRHKMPLWFYLMRRRY